MRAVLVMLAFAPLAFMPDPATCGEIHEAARAGDLERVVSLVAADTALVNAQDADGRTALHWAASGRRLEIISYLLQHGARVNEQTVGGETPLHIVAADDAVDAAALLLRAGADLERKNSYGRTPLLLCARERGGPEMTRLLLDAGAAVNATDRFNSTPLELAAWRAKSHVVDMLLDAGATVPTDGQKAGMLLELAASGGLDRLFDQLQGKAGGPAPQPLPGPSLVHVAAAGGSPHIVEALISLGLGADPADRYGWTPLHYASRNGRLSVVKLLLDRGAAIDARTIMGQTSYNLAVDEGRTEVASLLGNRGADRQPMRFPRLEGDYLGQQPPERAPEIFALGIVSSIWGLHSTIAFSPDGAEACWAAMVDTPGAVYSEGVIFMSRRVGGAWMAPVPAPFSNGYGNGEPFYSPDGSRLYFNSDRPLPGDGNSQKERIWYVDRAAEGWTEPQPVDAIVNDQEMHWQFSVDRDNNIYFGSRAGGGLGMADIYCARMVDGRYTKPENLGSLINTASEDHCPFIAPDGNYLIFARGLPTSDLLISFREENGSWSAPEGLGSLVNTEEMELCPVVTSDGKYLFFLSTREGESHPYWVATADVAGLRPVAR